MKNIISKNIENIKNIVMRTKNNHKFFNKFAIKNGLYSTVHTNLIKKLLLLDKELGKIDSEIIDIEEATCRLLQRW